MLPPPMTKESAIFGYLSNK